MQFPEKLKNQTWKNVKKSNFGPDFGPFGPNLGLKTYDQQSFIFRCLSKPVQWNLVKGDML